MVNLFFFCPDPKLCFHVIVWQHLIICLLGGKKESSEWLVALTNWPKAPNQSTGFYKPLWLHKRLKIKEFNMHKIVRAWGGGVGGSWTNGMGVYWLEGSTQWCEMSDAEPQQLQQSAWACLWPASSLLLIYFHIPTFPDRTRERQSGSSAAEA